MALDIEEAVVASGLRILPVPEAAGKADGVGQRISDSGRLVISSHCFNNRSHLACFGFQESKEVRRGST